MLFGLEEIIDSKFLLHMLRYLYNELVTSSQRCGAPDEFSNLFAILSHQVVFS